MPKSPDSDSETKKREASLQTDRHIETCSMSGGGEDVCLEGYLLAVREREV